MDGLTFAAEVVRALAWPVSVLLVALMIRKPVAELVPFIRRLKYKEIEMEFSLEVSQLKAKALPPPAQPATQTPISHGTPDLPERLSARRQELLNMVPVSTRVAVMEAWLEVESAATEVASSFWAMSPNHAMRNYSRLGDYLFQCKVIDKDQLDTFKRLKYLRNNAAHAKELDLSEGDAVSYVEVAMLLAAQIRDH